MEYNITYRQKDKGWQYIISCKQNGKWKQLKSKQGFKKKLDAKPEAEKMLDELKKDITFHVPEEYEGITFKEFADMFVEHEKLYKEGNTIKTYKTAMNNFEDLNKIEISKIKLMDIQKCTDKLTENKLKNATIKKYLAILSTIFNAAENKYKIINHNPITNIDIPKSTKAKEKRALTQSELNDLLSKIKNKKHHLISAIASECGLRIGEIMGLTWDKIDEKNSIIKVSQQWKKLKMMPMAWEA